MKVIPTGIDKLITLTFDETYYVFKLLLEQSKQIFKQVKNNGERK